MNQETGAVVLPMKKPAQKLAVGREQAPPPKNGTHYVAMLVGGPEDIYREVDEKLAKRRAILTRYHREYKKIVRHPERIPVDVDLIIILKDMIDHATYWKTKDSAKQKGIQVIVTQRKWTAMNQALWFYGYRRTAMLPLNIMSTHYRHAEPEQEIMDAPPEGEPPMPFPDIHIAVSPEAIAAIEAPPPVLTPEEIERENVVQAAAVEVLSQVPEPGSIPLMQPLLSMLRKRMKLDRVKSILLTNAELSIQYEDG